MLLLIYLVSAIGFSFYCSVAEAVLLSITPSFIATLNKTKPIAAKRLSRLKANIDRPLAAILSLNTIAHTIGAAGVGAEASKLYGDTAYGGHAVGIASALMTLLILIFSEIIPKTIGALHWRSLGPFVATSVGYLIVLLYPLVWLSEQLTKLLSGGKGQHTLTRDELSAMAEIGAQQGVLDDHESRVFQSLMRLPDLTAEDIMTPRVVIIAFPETMTVGELLSKTLPEQSGEPEAGGDGSSDPGAPTQSDEVVDLPVSRIPIYDQQLDRITGFVLKVDLLLAHTRGQSSRTLKEFSRPVAVVRHNRPLPKLLEILLEGRHHLAMVSDSYGSIVGLVTLEDLVETLLGLEIVDESDRQVDLQQYARKRWEERAARIGIQPLDEPVEEGETRGESNQGSSDSGEPAS
ncbi:CNNM domain-containing protein [Rhodopirellula sp. P2]|uniref:CNNM domain-containing protein n=1 Tax=Rhodopirellula sp. P2 TaxID=2127060 RepID=UPI0023678C90|nr:hemolysin family protein [Rhodopirellula sp. P2]WDQ19106.1 hemolysin family protein [Rhodopirellula sp. P2]